MRLGPDEAAKPPLRQAAPGVGITTGREIADKRPFSPAYAGNLFYSWDALALAGWFENSFADALIISSQTTPACKREADWCVSI
jgi:hypothetical protein